MAQQDLITIHHVETWNQQIAPHEDLVGMLQLVRKDRKITIITKEPGKRAELIEIPLMSRIDLDETHIFGLQLLENEIRVYRITAPTLDNAAEVPLEQPRGVGPGLVITENPYPAEEDPKAWSRQYHAELDHTVVRQTENAVIIEHDLQGITPETPVNCSLEPTIRGNDIQYYKSGSGNLTITLLRNEMMYRVKQEQVRSDGTQDNHTFSIPALIAVPDLPSTSGDVPALKLRYDEGSQEPTEIRLNQIIKETILNAITDMDLAFSTDFTDDRDEQLKLTVTFKQLNPDNTEVTPRRSKEASIHLASLIAHWGEIQGDLGDQTDLQNALDTKANIVFSFTKPDGTVINLDMAEVPPLMDEKISLHDGEPGAHPFILQEIADTRQQITDDIADHDGDTTAHPFILQEIADTRQQITDDIADHDGEPEAHPFILQEIADTQQQITNDIRTHNENAIAHPAIRRDLQQEFETHLDAHNTAPNAHQNIQTSWNTRLEEHNQDPLEDQHPLIRHQIAELTQAMLPNPRTLPDGDYKIRVTAGVVTFEPV